MPDLADDWSPTLNAELRLYTSSLSATVCVPRAAYPHPQRHGPMAGSTAMVRPRSQAVRAAN